MKSVWRHVLAAAITLGLVTAWGCGGRNDEVIYLDVFNGYPGSENVSVYGPTGTVTSDLSFGQRTSNFTTINRNIGQDFEIQIQGATSTAEKSLPLFDMYPHESATLFVKRRSGPSTVDTTFFRHVRTGYKREDRQCAMVFDNALSARDPNTTTYRYVPLFKVRPSCAGYVEQIGSYREDGYEDSDKINPPEYLFRPDLYDDIELFPWFAPVEASQGEIVDIRDVSGCPAYGSNNTPANSSQGGEDDSQGGGSNQNGNGNSGNQGGEPIRGQVFADNSTYRFAWAPARSILTRQTANELGRTINIDPRQGNIVGPPPTRQYMECIGWNPDQSVEKNVKNLEETNRTRITRCKGGSGASASVESVTLGNSLLQYQFRAGLGADVPPGQCGFRVRVASDFFSIFRRSQNEPGGEPVQQTFSFPPSQISFWVLYGRPIDPRIESWGVADKKSGGGFVKLPEYPGSPSPQSNSNGSNSGSNSN